MPNLVICRVLLLLCCLFLMAANSKPDLLLAEVYRELARPPGAPLATFEEAMVGNICRCGTYNRIKTAIRQASTHLKEAKA